MKYQIPNNLKFDDSCKSLIESMFNSTSLKFLRRKDEQLTEQEKNVFKNKVEELYKQKTQEHCVLLLRKENKKNFKKIFTPDVENQEIIFLLGAKAKNYITKLAENRKRDRLSFKRINDIGIETAKWIFEKYSEMNIDELKHPVNHNAIDYFKIIINKRHFSETLNGNRELFDYYLFGLHTHRSNNLVFFVSSTTSPATALTQFEGDLLILFWIPEPSTKYSKCKSDLDNMKSEVESLNLPILDDSFYPEQNEYSIKGAIFPHFIIGVFDIVKNEFMVSPHFFNDRDKDWISEGFTINQSNFNELLSQSGYWAGVTRFYNGIYRDSEMQNKKLSLEK